MPSAHLHYQDPNTITLTEMNKKEVFKSMAKVHRLESYISNAGLDSYTVGPFYVGDPIRSVPYDMISRLAQWYAQEAEEKLEAMAREPEPLGYVDPPPPYEEMSWEVLAREAGFAAERI
ncbi:MAG: hypothetical protein Q9208_001218 [Pyrenodesmia sp. 3 TL-2023]